MVSPVAGAIQTDLMYLAAIAVVGFITSEQEQNQSLVLAIGFDSIYAHTIRFLSLGSSMSYLMLIQGSPSPSSRPCSCWTCCPCAHLIQAPANIVRCNLLQRNVIFRGTLLVEGLEERTGAVVLGLEFLGRLAHTPISRVHLHTTSQLLPRPRTGRLPSRQGHR